MVSFDTVLVPAVTLTWLSRFADERLEFVPNAFIDLGAIEAMVLFDRILVESRSFEEYQCSLPRLEDLDSGKIQPVSYGADTERDLIS